MLIICSNGLSAQSLGINYQAVARSNTGSLLSNTLVNVRFLVRTGSAVGTVVYEETHAPSTNAYGLFSLVIGTGTVVSGTFDAIDWAGERYFLEVQLNGSSAGATEFVAVPYAKVATDMQLADLDDVSATAPASGQLLQWNGSEWAPASGGQWLTQGNALYYDAGKVFVGRSTQITGQEVFGIRGTAGAGSYAGMYVEGSDVASQPFYGYATNGAARAWTYYRGVDTTWRLYLNGDRLRVTADGTFQVGNELRIAGTDGDLSFNSAEGSIQFPAVSAAAPAMLYQFASGTANADRMVLAHSPAFSNWGLRYRDLSDAYDFLGSGTAVMTISLGNQRTGVRTTAPTHDLHLTHTTGAGSTNASQGLKLQNEGTANQSWTLYTVNNGGELWLYSGTTNVGRFATTGAYTTVSDERLKTDIRPMATTLDKVMALKPMTYRYTHPTASASLSLGFLAQEVAPIFPELVNYATGDADQASYTVDYAGFSVIALKAIQEQQQVIETQQQALESMQQQLGQQQSTMQQLLDRIAQLESTLND
ncbi:MAG: hypothetical protein OHK0039_02970 [Bacteroidia bacterium]